MSLKVFTVQYSNLHIVTIITNNVDCWAFLAVAGQPLVSEAEMSMGWVGRPVRRVGSGQDYCKLRWVRAGRIFEKFIVSAGNFMRSYLSNSSIC